MLDNEPTGGAGTDQAPAATTNTATTTGRTPRRATRPAGAPNPVAAEPPTPPASSEPAEPAGSAGPAASPEPADGAEPVKKATRTRRRTTKAAATEAPAAEVGTEAGDDDATSAEPVKKATRTRRKTAKAAATEAPAPEAVLPETADQPASSERVTVVQDSADAGDAGGWGDPFAGSEAFSAPAPVMFAAPVPVLFQAPSAEDLARDAARAASGRVGDDADREGEVDDELEHDEGDDDEIGEDGRRRRRRGRRGRGRGKGGAGDEADGYEHDDDADEAGSTGGRSRRSGRSGRDGDDGDGPDDADGRGRTRGSRGSRAKGDDRDSDASGGGRSRGDADGSGRGRADDGDGERGRGDSDGSEKEGRRRRRRGERADGEGEAEVAAEAADDGTEVDADGTRRRRRRRRRGGAGDGDTAPDDPPNTVVRIREPRKAVDEVQGVSGSTRLEAKRQRRRDGRDQRRTRPAILSESEFLARREAVDRQMVVRQAGERTQIAVLEDDVLVEHYVAQASGQTMVGNVYLGKVQNVLPSMEAAFIDIGRGRNAVLYAGEVNWDAAGLEGRTRAIQAALKPGDSVLVQVTKDPIGHKGARLTSHVTLSGRHLVYVPGGHASGISRKLPDTERKRLRDVLKKLVPEHAGVIVRTAAEGASEDDLARDVTRLQALWDSIEKKSGSASAPSLLYEEPDLVIRVVRDLFNEDIKDLHVQGDEAWEMVEQYVSHVSPDLAGRLHRHIGAADVFTEWRVDEQLMKALDRKVYLPSGGSLVIDRTEAMTVIDVNTGKFIGSGGNLEETVTRNNLEAAEEIVRQLRLRDVGGIIVIDFIDMVLESNRELVLRRLTECLGRDRTKHQVTEITSLGLVQMTRKRLGQPLIDAFSETCEHCKGRGVIIHLDPAPPAKASSSDGGSGRSSRRRKGRSEEPEVPEVDATPEEPEEPESTAAVAEDTDREVLDDHDLEPEEGSSGSHRRRRSSSRRRAKAAS
jgi:ribonuclease E